MSRQRILVVEDEILVALDLKGILEGLGYEVMGPAASGRDALKAARSAHPDLALMDVQLKGDMDGIETARVMRTELNVPVVYVTAYTDNKTTDRAKLTEPYGYIHKPFNASQLRSTIEMALYKHEMETRLRESEERFATTLRSIGEAVISTDRARSVTFMNAKAEALTGWPQDAAKGRMLEQILHLQDSDGSPNRLPAQVFERGMPVAKSGMLLLDDRSGAEVPVDVNAAPIRDALGAVTGLVLVLRDMTHAEELRKQLLQSQKMEAIGTLAGGIAHDFNNILAAVIGFTEMARLKASDEDFVRGNLDMILKASRRARDLVNHILTFSRKSEGRRKPFHLRHIVKENLKMLRASLPATIDIKLDVRTSSDLVSADPVQIHQVVMNLCANAAHAMGKAGGVLEIGLDETAVPGTEPEPYPGLAPGAYLRLTVSDTGHGMVKEVLERIFDPFFTTKKPGEGTGMGLAVVHGIVKSHGGAVFAQSEPGHGSTFTVLLPRLETAPSRQDDDHGGMPCGNERILFVDDEEDLADMAVQMLGQLGYKADVLTDSLEALRRLRSTAGKFDLAILDQTMPRMTGLALAAELQKLQPDLPVILCTGFSEAVTAETAAAAGIRHILKKPLFMNDLARAIRNALEE